jgi:heme-degrading monooxygenase HmoA
MVLEVAILDVLPGREAEFESAFAKAERLIGSASGYVSHELKRCLERPSRYILLVNWQRLEDHTEGFRKSAIYEDWKALLHHFYDPFPTVEHYADVPREASE